MNVVCVHASEHVHKLTAYVKACTGVPKCAQVCVVIVMCQQMHEFLYEHCMWQAWEVSGRNHARTG